MTAAALLACLLGLGGARAATPVAGGVVSSDEWRVKRGADTEEEFTGNVRYRTGPNVVRCDWALYKHNEQTWQLKDHVALDRALASGGRATATGQRGFLKVETRSGWLRGSASQRLQFARYPEEGGEPDRGEADRLDWEGRSSAALTGEVHLWGPRLECWADRADYEDAAGELRLSGSRPALRKFPGWSDDDDWAGALKADEARAWQARRAFAADGRVVGWLEFRRPKSPKK